jgi:hypothetical protein
MQARSLVDTGSGRTVLIPSVKLFETLRFWRVMLMEPEGESLPEIRLRRYFRRSTGEGEFH